MTKKEDHKRGLVTLFDAFLETRDDEALFDYISANSNLPGPRGNLELARGFGDAVEGYTVRAAGAMWDLCTRMAMVSAEEAPVNAPEELIPFCGAVGIGAIGAVCPAFFDDALIRLRQLANDPRWRMREAVAFGLQRLLARRPAETMEAVQGWAVADGWLEMRAAVAGIAEPAVLKDRKSAPAALHIHRRIFDCLHQAEDRRSEPFRVLRKGLAYTLSVVVQAVPEQGFAFIDQLVDSGDPDIRWIVKQNLKKNRLVRTCPARVEAIARQLNR